MNIFKCARHDNGKTTLQNAEGIKRIFFLVFFITGLPYFVLDLKDTQCPKMDGLMLEFNIFKRVISVKKFLQESNL